MNETLKHTETNHLMFDTKTTGQCEGSFWDTSEKEDIRGDGVYVNEHQTMKELIINEDAFISRIASVINRN